MGHGRDQTPGLHEGVCGCWCLELSSYHALQQVQNHLPLLLCAAHGSSVA